MRYSANAHSLAKQRAFSLLEILVVLLVVGIAVSGVSLVVNRGGPDQELNDVVERFAALSQHASDMAVLTGEARGLVLEPPAWRDNPDEEGWLYRWQKMTFEGWVDDPQVPPVEIPVAIDLSISIDEQLWSWERAPENKLPIIAFYPAGDITPFELEFIHDDVEDRAEHIVINDWGEVVWQEKQALLEELQERF